VPATNIRPLPPGEGRGEGLHLQRSLLILLCVTIALSSAAARAAAGPSPVEVEAKVDRATITVGDRLTYTLLVRHRPDYKVRLPAAGAGLEAFEIKDHQELPPEKLPDGRIQEGRVYVLSTFTTGDYVLAPLAVPYAGPGGKSGEVKTAEIKIRVRSILPADAKDIRDIHGPAEIPVSRARLIKFGLVVLGVAGLAAGWLIWRRRKLRPKVEETALLPPYQQARRDLDELANGPLLNSGQIKEFYVRLSDILRTYLGRRYRISALVETSSELFEALRQAGVETEILGLVTELFESGDLVKFAKHFPSGTETREHLEGAYHLLEITRENPELVPVAEAVA